MGMYSLRKKPSVNRKHFEKFPAGKEAKNLLSAVLKKIDNRQRVSIDLIRKVWVEILGEKYASMTEVVVFDDGVLTIKINSAPLFSILKAEQKSQLEHEMRKRMPTLKLQKLNFRR